MATSNFFLKPDQVLIIRYALCVYWSNLVEKLNGPDRLYVKANAVELIKLLDMLPYFDSDDYKVLIYEGCTDED